VSRAKIRPRPPADPVEPLVALGAWLTVDDGLDPGVAADTVLANATSEALRKLARPMLAGLIHERLALRDLQEQPAHLDQPQHPRTAAGSGRTASESAARQDHPGRALGEPRGPLSPSDKSATQVADLSGHRATS
jgi:hypothetical protein